MKSSLDYTHFDSLVEEKIQEYKKLSDCLNMKIECENQKQLALMGAKKEIVEANEIHSEIYRVTIYNPESAKKGGILRIYQQCLNERNIKFPLAYIKSLGMKIIQYSYSSFGACFFIEVDKIIDNMPDFIEMVNNPEKFDWNAY